MEPLELAIQFSDLFEATGSEGSEVAYLIDQEILPYIHTHLREGDGVGLGARFTKVLDQVRNIVSTGNDRVRAAKEMMKRVLTDYTKRTNDAVNARDIFYNAIHQGTDDMITVAAAGLLANALARQHPQQAVQMMRSVGSRMTGERPPVSENASGAATGSAAIAAVPTGVKAKRRKESIFAEMSWDDLQDRPPTINLLRETAGGIENRSIGGILVDPTTAELVMATYVGLDPQRKRRFEAKEVSEMIRIATRLFEQGAIQIIVEEA
jgi:hypothetical protein